MKSFKDSKQPLYTKEEEERAIALKKELEQQDFGSTNNSPSLSVSEEDFYLLERVFEAGFCSEFTVQRYYQKHFGGIKAQWLTGGMYTLPYGSNGNKCYPWDFHVLTSETDASRIRVCEIKSRFSYRECVVIKYSTAIGVEVTKFGEQKGLLVDYTNPRGQVTRTLYQAEETKAPIIIEVVKYIKVVKGINMISLAIAGWNYGNDPRIMAFPIGPDATQGTCLIKFLNPRPLKFLGRKSTYTEGRKFEYDQHIANNKRMSDHTITRVQFPLDG